MYKITAIAVILILLVGGFILFNNQTQSTTSSNPDTNNTVNEFQRSLTVTPASKVSAAVKTIEVEGKDFSFTPSKITVKKGDTVRIVFRNTDGFHDWVLDEFNAKTQQIQAGQTDTIEFVADKTGTYEYYCSVGNHRQMGMKGNLIVE